MAKPPSTVVLAPNTWVTGSSVGVGGRPLRDCCVAFDGHRLCQVPAHLGDEQVQVVAAYVIEPRGNESKRLLTFSGPMGMIPRAAKERHRIMINYPVSTTIPAGLSFVCSQGFPQTATNGREISTPSLVWRTCRGRLEVR